jgi:hypothetical protein
VSDWLEDLKPGDRVIVDSGFFGPTLRTVERVTATQILVGQSRYRRSSGSPVGGDPWARNYLREATPECVAQVRQRSLAERLAKTKWSEYPLERLEAVAALLKDAPK